MMRLAYSALFWVPLHGGPLKPEWIELSHPFNSETIPWPTAQKYERSKVFQGFTDKGFYYASNDISTAEHCGTHLDAPIHFAEGKWTTDQIPLDRLIGPAIKIDISSKAAQVKYDLIAVFINAGFLPAECTECISY